MLPSPWLWRVGRAGQELGFALSQPVAVVDGVAERGDLAVGHAQAVAPVVVHDGEKEQTRQVLQQPRPERRRKTAAMLAPRVRGGRAPGLGISSRRRLLPLLLLLLRLRLRLRLLRLLMVPLLLLLACLLLLLLRLLVSGGGLAAHDGRCLALRCPSLVGIRHWRKRPPAGPGALYVTLLLYHTISEPTPLDA